MVNLGSTLNSRTNLFEVRKSHTGIPKLELLKIILLNMNQVYFVGFIPEILKINVNTKGF